MTFRWNLWWGIGPVLIAPQFWFCYPSGELRDLETPRSERNAQSLKMRFESGYYVDHETLWENFTSNAPNVIKEEDIPFPSLAKMRAQMGLQASLACITHLCEVVSARTQTRHARRSSKRLHCGELEAWDGDCWLCIFFPCYPGGIQINGFRSMDQNYTLTIERKSCHVSKTRSKTSKCQRMCYSDYHNFLCQSSHME